MPMKPACWKGGRQKTSKKQAYFCAFLFTSFGRSLMIEIELRRAYPRTLRPVCSMMLGRGVAGIASLHRIDAYGRI